MTAVTTTGHSRSANPETRHPARTDSTMLVRSRLARMKTRHTGTSRPPRATA
jgi:hypothetical protein